MWPSQVQSRLDLSTDWGKETYLSTPNQEAGCHLSLCWEKKLSFFKGCVTEYIKHTPTLALCLRLVGQHKLICVFFLSLLFTMMFCFFKENKIWVVMKVGENLEGVGDDKRIWSKDRVCNFQNNIHQPKPRKSHEIIIQNYFY